MDIFEQVKKILCEQLDLEEEQVTDEDIEEMHTVGDIVKYVEEKVAE